MRIALRILAVLIGLAGLLTLVGGIAGAVYVGPDDTVPLSDQKMNVSGVALVTAPGLFTVYGPTLHLHAASAGGQPLFMGVAPSYAISNYLNDRQQTQLTGYTWNGGLNSSELEGQTSVTGPAGLDFWTAKQQGKTEAALEWPMPNGAYDVVVMRANGSALGEVQLTAGLELVGLFQTFVVIASSGLAAVAIMVAVFVLTRRRTPQIASPGAAA